MQGPKVHDSHGICRLEEPSRAAGTAQHERTTPGPVEPTPGRVPTPGTTPTTADRTVQGQCSASSIIVGRRSTSTTV